MEEVKNWLCSIGLGKYWHNFEEHGWEELSLLTEMSDVDLELCITKRGHRAKFRKALRSFTNTSAASDSSASLNSVADLDKKPFEVDGMSQEKSNHASQLAKVTEITPQLDTTGSLHTARGIRRTNSIGTAREVDTKESVDVVRKMDKTDSIDPVREADSVEIVQEVVDVLQTVEENRSETKPNESTSILARNELSRNEEANIESCTSRPFKSEVVTMDRSYTVTDDIVLEGTADHFAKRVPPNITVIERSENTTVYQGPTQLGVGLESTNPVAILKGQMEMLADSYRSKDDIFVETKAYKELKQVVKEMHWATLLGKPGDGKSATAAHLLLQYTAREYEPVFLSSPRDWKMLISDNSSLKQIAVVDDMFGQSYLDDNKNVGEWKSMIESMSRIVEQRNGNLLVICTSRRYIFKDIETALGKFVCFSRHAIVDMTDLQYKLSCDEKETIFKTFAEAYTIESDTSFCNHIRYVDPPHGFPHCVELYCGNIFLREEGIAFFKNPVKYVKHEILNFKDNDRVKFLVLLLVLHKGEKLGLDALDRLTENTTDDDKKFFKTAGVSLETAIPDIHRALTGLTNTYLKQNNDGSYSFSHQSLKEILAFIYISANPSHAIRVLEFQHIVAFSSSQRETDNGLVSNACLPSEPLFKRINLEIEGGHVSTVCNYKKVWSDKTFVNEWLVFIEKEQLAFLETVLFPEQHARWNDLLVCLIKRKLYDAATALLKNESIGKTLLDCDLWPASLQTGLESACYTYDRNIPMIEALVSIRIGENRIKLDGSRILLDMLKRSQAEVAIILIDHTQINFQYAPYFYHLAGSAIDTQPFEVLCKKLLQAGVNINQTSQNDVPAVFRCLVRFEDKGYDRLLCMIRNGANIHKHCKHGNIVLYAINTICPMSYVRCLTTLTKLSELDVDFCCTDSYGSNALHIMCQKRPDESSNGLLNYLLNKGVSPATVNKSGVVPLMFALKNSFSIDTIKILAKESPLKHVDNSGRNYIHYLFGSSITDTNEFCDKCEILIMLGSSINKEDNTGKRPVTQLMERNFSIHAGFDYFKLVRFLYKREMDIHAIDNRGKKHRFMHVELSCCFTGDYR